MLRTLIKETPLKIGERVRLQGWVDNRRDHGKLIFFDLRDATGTIQLVVMPGNKELHALADTLRHEWVVAVEGTVQKRPEGMQNPELETGAIELGVGAIEVISEAKTPPFLLSTDGKEISEEIRLKYRYLDLRRARLQKNIRERHRVIQFLRNTLTERGFVEIETPILTKSTPEGARDYVVPSRQNPGNFYALPQSPQQYKQLLMVAGFEKYFQIARCFRDEDTRGDRQPEFTQLDIEMSFVTQDEILDLVEDLYTRLVKTLYPEKRISQIPFPRLTYAEAMETYGTDKPDLRENPDDPNELAFAFIVDFPMFEWKDSENRWDAVHHPFTKMRTVRDENLENLVKKLRGNHRAPVPLSDQHDFVLNGYEIGGGSVREHNPKILETVFEIMGHDKKDIHEKFGHLLEAFEYGVPPHGGFAPGIDRFVMLLMNEPNIREVIAFPKTGDGRDPMMGSPSEISKEQLADLGLEIKKKK